MAERIEDYALVGDLQTAALVGRSGSVDWLPFPRFDSSSCFGALLGGREHGRWLIAPASGGPATDRRYRDGTLVLESEWQTRDGRVRVTDFMPQRETKPDIVRIVEGLEGAVRMRTELVIRLDYGSVVPWVRRLDERSLLAVGGPDGLLLRTPVDLQPEGMTHTATFTVRAGERVPFTLTWFPSHERLPKVVDPERALADTERLWHEWVAGCKYDGEYAEAVHRSLIVLKALTYAPTGGIVAAPTTSLPELIGGERNWDYRYCWLRDATFTLYALLNAGFTQEASAWRDWLLRSVAGDASKVQILYGVGGQRRVPEFELPWLPGYAGSSPVRIGNAAHEQFQLDVYGEVMDVLHQARMHGLDPSDHAWSLQRTLLDFLEGAWDRPDEGIWEVRGPRRHFVHSKVLAWVAFDRAVQGAERLGLDGPVERWRRLRQEIHDEVCREGFNTKLGSFTQSYGSAELDASTLLIPILGFLPPDDPRVVGTVEAVQRDLTRNGFVERYRTRAQNEVDGLSGGEGVFLPCSFWLVDALLMIGRRGEAERLFEDLLGIRNDLGLLAEEYDPAEKRLLGNFPQAFTHVGLVNSAYNLSQSESPHRQRPQRA
ncbi:MAG TPA: glycoside hydrolase family 15 protein [Gaiellaceae bacterium]|jgi:GH15 family glucan-1,4-alpha-glucosidase|nr:glycoside hydrolase family 15 protein [Gaiellaceae bacterium]